MKFDHAIIVGAGGTGSHLLEPLSRLLLFHENGTRNIVVIDGDVYEEHNSVRQLFDNQLLGRNKAEAAAERLGFANIQPIPRYVDGETFLNILSGITEAKKETKLLVILCVDNDATRHDIIAGLDAEGYTNFALVTPGNGYNSGQVMSYVKWNDEALTPHPFAKQPGLANPEDHIPGFGCQVEAASTPQLITANAMAAVGTLCAISAMLDDGEWYDEIHFSCVRQKLVPSGAPIRAANIVITKPEKLTKATKKKTTKKKAAKKKAAKKKATK